MPAKAIPVGIKGVYKRGRGYFGLRYRFGVTLATETLPSIQDVLERLDVLVREAEQGKLPNGTKADTRERDKMNRASYDAWLHDRRRRSIPAEGLRNQ